MSQAEPTRIKPPTAEQRRIATESFDKANRVISTGNYDYGINLLLTCCKLDPGNTVYRTTLRRAQKAKYRNNLRGSPLAFLTTSRHRARLKVAQQRRDYLAVLEHGEQILSRNPWDLSTQMDMAEAFEALELLDLAVFELDQARQKFGRDATLNRALARLFEKRGNFAHAIKLWQIVKETDPSDLEASHKAKDLAASETIQRGQYEESAQNKGDESDDPRFAPAPAAAASTASKSTTPATASGTVGQAAVDRLTREAAPLLAQIEANPTEASFYLKLAELYRKFRQDDRARAVLQQGLAATGQNFQIQVELMESDLEPLRKNFALTQDKLRKRIAGGLEAADEEHTLEDLRRLQAKLRLEILNREIELYRLKAERFPTDLSHRLELGNRLYLADRIDDAISELQQARKDVRLQGKALMQLGFCFKKRNNWRLAQRNFEEALALLATTDEPARKEILFALASGFAENGDLARAIDMGHELANLDFSFREIGKRLDEWQERLQNAAN
ncbi:tetratricopeptide repeat protein [Tuwongella immobilis]|uniref:Tetratricopeptide repeat protein n=1 Tax=Tuwongella immobilis TaxID=692036 RepID=A0A6C2YTC5_9BACT|nr:hypothetical protein [Tuwongella immobilis]VIP04587.1 tetratricopeptide domain protein : Tetratricopeptide TPR_4 OS=Planctomyces maris DSM 8797 GN=PM8797T_26355 PE=4 SV=1: TPR_2 [Tuwongella immobilis]VTS06535.1 tetratricopeptide domain protein : Tetratricopeptide TPR_4 OS=Planctomyces maris DSM 8797 GN=PM8797T_26355 PE=4 SV=1: TPR_2 [Tuwongella immobilis]